MLLQNVCQAPDNISGRPDHARRRSSTSRSSRLAQGDAAILHLPLIAPLTAGIYTVISPPLLPRSVKMTVLIWARRHRAHAAPRIRLPRGGHRTRPHCRFVLSLIPLYTRFTNIFGASISEATLRPNPRWTPPRCARMAARGRRSTPAWTMACRASWTSAGGSCRSRRRGPPRDWDPTRNCSWAPRNSYYCKSLWKICLGPRQHSWVPESRAQVAALRRGGLPRRAGCRRPAVARAVSSRGPGAPRCAVVDA